MHAYEHGIVIDCADGIRRRIFPRFFTYSADYPEKYACKSSTSSLCLIVLAFRVLLASIKYLARCPCPRCFIQKDQIGAIGTTIDEQRRRHERVDSEHRQGDVEMTRSWIFEKGYGIISKHIENILQPTSLVPTRVVAIIPFFYHLSHMQLGF
jgi:Plavaka transposase